MTLNKYLGEFHKENKLPKNEATVNAI